MKNCLRVRSENVILLLLFSAMLCSCHSGNKNTTEMYKPGKDQMADLNQYFVQKDKEIIESYIERKDLKMTESSTGLLYAINKPGSGDLFRENDRVVMKYECDLLDGTICYSSATTGPKEVIIGKSKVEQGLNEGLLLLRPGAEAIFIIPPYLGFGLLGDGGKIPPRAITIYRVSITLTRSPE